MNKGSSGDVWKPKSRMEQPGRDEKRGYSSLPQQASPSSAERSTERNAESSSSWQTVEKRRTNP